MATVGSVHFSDPIYLALFALVPALWWVSWRSLAGLGWVRWGAATAFRTLLAGLFLVALAGLEIVEPSRQLAVVYLVDRSLSLPPSQIGHLTAFVSKTTRDRVDSPDQASGVITFAGRAAVESPVQSGPLELAETLGGDVQPEQTNLAGAIRLARAAFPPHAARRLVILTDGRQTIGDALAEARTLSGDGIGIDVVPVIVRRRGEMAIERVVTPPDVRRQARFFVQVVARYQPDDDQADRTDGGERPPVTGRLSVRRLLDGQAELIAEQTVELATGANVFTIPDRIEQAGFLTYEATLVPDDPRHDHFLQNNRSTALVQVRGPGRVLLIVASEAEAEARGMASTLRENGLEVTIQPTDRLFTSLAELQSYDLVMLANVPRTGGANVNDASFFTDEQVRLLAENTQRTGCGLILLGGPDSFGAGGWTGTEVERAMPVDFQVKNAKVQAVGALMLVIDGSGSMDGEKNRLSRAAAVEAVKMLGDRDYVGVIAFDDRPRLVVPLQTASQRARIVRQIQQIGASGGTNMYPAMADGFRALERSNASVKHMVVLTDGQTQPGAFAPLVNAMRDQGMTISTVALGADADVRLLSDIATRGGGKFYRVNSPRAIPRVFMQETRRVVRPVIYENPQGIMPQRTASHEILTGLDETMPPLTGYVLTTPKTSPLTEVPLRSPLPGGEEYPLLATWTYGLGRAAVWTSDTGSRWAGSWDGWADQEKFLVQLVRWTMRPTQGDPQTIVTAERDGDAIRVTVQALTPTGDFRNGLVPVVGAIGPGGEGQTTGLAQTGPGTYSGHLPLAEAGSYLIAVATEAGQSPVRIGLDVGYSDEFRTPGEAGLDLLQSLAALTPPGGSPGRLLPPIDLDASREAVAQVADAPDVDPYRRDLTPGQSQQAAWWMALWAAAALFLFDVANRRIAWSGASPWGWLKGRFAQPHDESPSPLARLTAVSDRVRASVPGGALSPPPQTESPHAESLSPSRPASPSRGRSDAASEATLGLDDRPSSDYLTRLRHARTRAVGSQPNTPQSPPHSKEQTDSDTWS